MTEYGEAIIEYLEDIMQEDDLYVRKSYIIISTYEPIEDAKRNLTLFCNTLKSSLNDIKISAKILDFNRAIDLLNKEINKDSTEDIVSIIKKGGLEEFVKGEKI